MQSQLWEGEVNVSSDDDNRLLGQILERSTSAPPMKSDASDLNFNVLQDHEDTFLFERARNGAVQATSRLNLFDTSGRDTAPVAVQDIANTGLLLDSFQQRAGRASAPGQYNPTSGGLAESLFSGGGVGSLRSQSGDMGVRQVDSRDGTSRFAFEAVYPSENDLERSKSAAPSFFGAPPGFGLTREHVGEAQSMLRSQSLDPQTLMELNQRRPSSAGVIGEQPFLSEGSGAVRPAPKTLMDLIHDESPSSYAQQRQSQASHNDRRQAPAIQSTDQMASQLGRSYTNKDPSQRRNAYDYQRAPAPRVEQTPVYAPTGSVSRGHVVPSQQQSAQYEPQPVYYEEQHVRHVPPVNAGLPTHIMHSGQPVYVSSTPYGYTTVQYHPSPSQHQHVTRHVHPSLQAIPSGHEYMPVVPMQGGTQGQVYWHQSDIQGAGRGGHIPSVALMNSQGGAVSMPRIRGVHQDAIPTRHSGSRGPRSPSEKGGRGRRGGGTPRRGGDSRHAPSSPTACPLLEEFRSTKHRDWTMLNIQGHVVEFCQDQNGSRFIQQRLQVGHEAEQKIVMTEVLPAVRRLRNDVFGNYVVQKLFEFGSPEMKSNLRDTLKGEMLSLSLQMYGCRVVQKALETLENDDMPSLLIEFHKNVVSCIHDQNGNHVIQKCIDVVSARAKQAAEAGNESLSRFFSEQIAFIIDDVLGSVRNLSCHPYGCRVLQRILEHCVDSTRQTALDAISQFHRPLLDDQYGNYVIQHVLQYGRVSDRQSILHIVVENGLLVLSKQKFASNVVEKLLKYGTPDQRNAVVREMLEVLEDSDGSAGRTTVVLLMVRDAYANYVVQTALDVVSDGEEKELLLRELNAHSEELRNYTFAKHIVAKLNSS